MNWKKSGALLLAFMLLASVIGACFPAPQVAKIDPTFASTLKDMMATDDALGSLLAVKLNGVAVNVMRLIYWFLLTRKHDRQT